MNRRDLIKITSIAGAAPILLRSNRALAVEPPLLSVDDPIAVALRYVEDGSAVAPDQYLRPTPDGGRQHCGNCALYKAVSAEAGSCGAIPGKLVLGEAWCSAWAPRA